MTLAALLGRAKAASTAKAPDLWEIDYLDAEGRTTTYTLDRGEVPELWTVDPDYRHPRIDVMVRGELRLSVASERFISAAAVDEPTVDAAPDW